MASVKEIRVKINSVQSIRRITHTMEMVATSRMRKAQSRMRVARPYCEKIRNVASHLSHAHSEYKHPFLIERETVKRVGIIIVTSDKGLCGGMNASVLRMAMNQGKKWDSDKIGVDICAIGGKGFNFVRRTGMHILSRIVGLGEAPRMDRMTGAIKVVLDAYSEGKIDALYICYTRFLNTMKQEPVIERLLPLSGDRFGSPPGEWDYIYEPDAGMVLDLLLARYVETLIYQAVAESMASEQSARMVAMKAATDNADHMINDLKLLYNKTRQAAITKEIAEIVAGAAAI